MTSLALTTCLAVLHTQNNDANNDNDDNATQMHYLSWPSSNSTKTSCLHDSLTHIHKHTHTGRQPAILKAVIWQCQISQSSKISPS